MTNGMTLCVGDYATSLAGAVAKAIGAKAIVGTDDKGSGYILQDDFAPVAPFVVVASNRKMSAVFGRRAIRVVLCLSPIKATVIRGRDKGATILADGATA